MGLVLDTSALISLERSFGTSAPLTLPVDQSIALPAIVWAEALIGVRMADDAPRAARRMARLDSIRRATGIEDFTPLVAEHYADIFSECSKKGASIPQNDMAVAATARSIGFGVLVGPQDEKHFREVENLVVQVISRTT